MNKTTGRLLCLLIALSVVGSGAAYAQDAEEEPLTEVDGWRSHLSTTLQGSQAHYANWQAGGVNTLAVTLGADGRFERVRGRFLHRHESRLAYGQIRQDTLGFRKATDLIRYGYELVTNGDLRWRPTLALTARTQFTAGFDYDPTPSDYDFDDPGFVAPLPGQPFKISDFLAPGVFTQSIGLGYNTGQGFRTRFGIGLKETVVAIPRLRLIHGNAADQAVRVELGLDALADFRRQLTDALELHSRLTGFYGLGTLDTPPDMAFENRLILSIAPLLNANLEVAMLFDRDVSRRLQVKEVLSVGLVYTLM
ncbi:hypothetical protein BH23BAC4_BH23BAC4_12970 [soil metagenome]